MEKNKIIDKDAVKNEIESEFLDNGMCVEVEILTQEDVKKELMYSSNFPMLTNETTDNITSNVDIEKSKFLNDKLYEDNWFSVNYCDIIVLFCLRVSEDNIVISAIETNSGFRYMG